MNLNFGPDTRLLLDNANLPVLFVTVSVVVALVTGLLDVIATRCISVDLVLNSQ